MLPAIPRALPLFKVFFLHFPVKERPVPRRPGWPPLETAPQTRPKHRSLSVSRIPLPLILHPLLRLRLPRLFSITLLGVLLLHGSTSPQALDPLGLLPGEELVLDSCLRVSVVNLTDRSGPLGSFDWATISLANECQDSRRHLQVGLLLLDPAGKPYGTKIWLLNRGEVLPPGGQIISRYPVPDPDDQYPLRWVMRLLSVEKPRPLHRAPGRGGNGMSAPAAPSASIRTKG